MDNQTCVRCGTKIGDREPFVDIQLITHFHADPGEVHSTTAGGDGYYCMKCMKEIEEIIKRKPAPQAETINRKRPCKIGDSVYRLCNEKGKWTIEKRTVKEINHFENVKKENGTEKPHDYFVIFHETGADILGERVFLKMEKAQKALLRRKREENMLQEMRKQPISELGFSHRTYNCLKRAGMQTVGDLLDASDEDLCRVRGLGAIAMAEIKKGKKEIYSKIANTRRRIG